MFNASIVKKPLVLICGVLMCALLIVFSTEAVTAAADALTLWARSVLPAIFPFFVCTSFIEYSGAKPTVGGTLLGFLFAASGGAPSGARLMAANGANSKESTRKCAALNMISPMYVCGALASSMMNNLLLALPIAIGHYGGAALFLLAFTFLDKKGKHHFVCLASKQSFEYSTLLSALVRAIGDGMDAAIRVLGTMMFFTVVCRIVLITGMAELIAYPFTALGANTNAVIGVMFGVIEMTTGCSYIASVQMPMQLSAALLTFILSFSGLCIMAQSAVFMRIRPLSYIAYKLMIALSCAVIAYCAAKLFLPDSVSVFAQPDIAVAKSNAQAASGIVFASSLSMGIIAVCASAISVRRQKR